MELTLIARKDSFMRVKHFSDFSNTRFKSETNVEIIVRYLLHIMQIINE